MSSVAPFTFDAVKLCVVSLNDKPWNCAREVCRVLEYGKTTKTADIVKHLCSQENHAHKCQLTGFVSATNLVNWPNDSQNMILTSMRKRCMSYYFLINSQKQKTLGSIVIM